MAKIGSIDVKASDALQHLAVEVRVIEDWRWRVSFALMRLAAWIGGFAVETMEDE